MTRRYSASFVAGNCEQMTALTAAAIHERFGGTEKLRTFLCDFRRDIGADTLSLGEELNGRVGEYSDAAIRFVLVERRRKSVRKDRDQVTDFPYVVYSSDGGQTWGVIDIICFDDAAMRKLAPRWQGVPAIPAPKMSVTWK